MKSGRLPVKHRPESHLGGPLDPVIQQADPQEYLRLRTVFNIEGHANSGTGYEKRCPAVVLAHGTLRDPTVPHRPANHRSGTIDPP